MTRARAATGLDDFGADTSFRPGLDALMRDIAAGAPDLQTGLIERVTGLLGARLRIVQDDRLHPEIREQAIVRPMFITGLPRTGTTITQDMLSLDPGARWPKEWEIAMPWPAPETATMDTDPRMAMIQGYMDAMVAGSPELLTVHRFDCRNPGECNTAMMYHFSSCNWYTEGATHGYGEWFLENCRIEGHYAEHKRLLQQWQWKGPPGRWQLKSPQHLFNLTGLFEIYPDARIVWTHRDPVLTFSSLCSMYALIHHAIGLATDPLQIGDMVRRTWTRALLNGVEDRAANTQIDRAVIDQPHKAIIADPLAAMKRNLEFFDQPITAEFEARLRNFLEADSRSQRAGKHTHSLDRYGLDPDTIRADLAPYYERFAALL